MGTRLIRSPRISPGPRRKTIWLSSAGITDKSNLAAATKILDQTFTGVAVTALGAFTIVRTRGMLFVAGDQNAALEEPFGGLGFMVVSSTAAGVGATAVPGPMSDEADDQWFVFENFVASADGDPSTQVNGSRVIHFDSKAMRKVEDGQAIAIVIENASAADGCQYILKFRMLVKLH